MKSYKDLETYKLAFEPALTIRENPLKLDTVNKFEVGIRFHEPVKHLYSTREAKQNFLQLFIRIKTGKKLWINWICLAQKPLLS